MKLRGGWLVLVVGAGCGGAVESTDPGGSKQGDSSGVRQPSPTPPIAGGKPSDPGGTISPPGPRLTEECLGKLACERVVFVSSKSYGSKLGGTTGADTACRDLAASATSARVKGRDFVAWLSSETGSAVDRLVHGTAAYLRPDGVQVAADWKAIVSGTLAAPIAVDENGKVLDNLGQDTIVWTASKVDGTYDNVGIMLPVGSCLGWNGAGGSDDFAVTGVATARNQQWTYGASANCFSYQARLYCIER